MTESQFDKLSSSIFIALVEAFEIFDQSGCGGVVFNGSEFEAEHFPRKAVIDSDGLEDFIRTTDIPTYDYHALAEEYTESYQWDIFAKAGINA